jgi:hypothetical protein
LFLAAMLVGVPAAAVKITTFAIVLCPVVVLIVYGRLVEPPGRRPSFVRLLVEMLCLAAIPAGLALLWTRFADAQKELNPSARFLVSGALHSWTMGTLEQRLTPATWVEILSRAPRAVDPLVLAVGLAASAVTRRFSGLCAICLGLYLLAPLLFVNLFYIHDYYAYANAVFLVAAAGLGLAALVEGSPTARYVGLVLLPLVFGLEVFRHREHYLPVSKRTSCTLRRLAESSNKPRGRRKSF